MSFELYSQIIALQHEVDNVKRGRNFEILIREIQPWDRRPPVVSSQDSEQLDGVFVFQNETYIIESKAVKKKITPGMPEWEDFELKLHRRRDKRVVGLFCCLFEVSKTIEKRVRDLNMNGMTTIVVSGRDWHELYDSKVSFESFLQYLKLSATVKNNGMLDSMDKALSWIYDGETINKNFKNNSWKISGWFLRRFKHRFHEQIFVERKVNIQITTFIKGMIPQSLKVNKNREAVKQIIILRDFSGSGKTTLTSDFASKDINGFCFATTANNDSIDKIPDELFNKINYPDFGLQELLVINKSLVYIIDSLDEVYLHNRVTKRKEIKSLFKRIEELNGIAQKQGLKFFPIILIFTIREDYWRDWEAVFEGRQDIIQIKKALTSYNPDEFSLALEKYENAYKYKILNKLSVQVREILSIPINLEIFSEANDYEGEIVVEDIWEGKILMNYFQKKEEAIFKHHIDGYNTIMFNRILCELAYSLLLNKSTLFSKVNFVSIVKKVFGNLSFFSDQILMNLISEQIIITDFEDVKSYRFKYNRFIEYLIALNIIYYVSDTSDYSFIDKSINVIYDSNIVSIFSVLNNLKHIGRTQYTEIEKEIVDYYSHSDKYLSKLLPELRGIIARGENVEEDKIRSIVTNNYTQKAEFSWDIFFVIAAKRMLSSKEIILSSFEIAWDTNKENIARWKLVQKMANRNLLLEEKVLFKLLKDGSPREWEEYLGDVLLKKLEDSFLNLWEEIQGDSVLGKIIEQNLVDWKYVNRLLDLIFRGEGFILGDILSNEKPREYVVFEVLEQVKLPNLSLEIRKLCDEYIEEFRLLFDKGELLESNSFIFSYRIKELTKDAYRYINIKLEDLLSSSYGADKIPFMNYLVHQYPKTKSILRLVCENKDLEIQINLLDNNNRSLFIEIIESDYEWKTELFEYVFLRGYFINQVDEEYIKQMLSNVNAYKNNELEFCLIGYCFMNVTNKDDYRNIGEISREIFTLLSMKFGKILSFRFSNMIQVANNALEHYKEYGDLFVKAFHVYGFYDDFMQKSSFVKKISLLDMSKTERLEKYKSTLKQIFPELFELHNI